MPARLSNEVTPVTVHVLPKHTCEAGPPSNGCRLTLAPRTATSSLSRRPRNAGLPSPWARLFFDPSATVTATAAVSSANATCVGEAARAPDDFGNVPRSSSPFAGSRRMRTRTLPDASRVEVATTPDSGDTTTRRARSLGKVPSVASPALHVTLRALPPPEGLLGGSVEGKLVGAVAVGDGGVPSPPTMPPHPEKNATPAPKATVKRPRIREPYRHWPPMEIRECRSRRVS